MGLRIDPGHEQTRKSAADLLRKYKIGKTKAHVSSSVQKRTGGSRQGIMIPRRRKSKKPLSAKRLFAAVAGPTVLVQTDRAKGSGVCISAEGHILTCSHVVPDGSGKITVFMFAVKNGRALEIGSSEASVVLRDREIDIAVLKLDQPVPTLKPLTFALSDAVTGDKVFALGSPSLGRQQLSHSLSEGIVSSGKRILDEYELIQHTAAVNPGNSGGPLLSEYGEILGIVVMRADLENTAFAIPASSIKASLGWNR